MSAAGAGIRIGVLGGGQLGLMLAEALDGLRTAGALNAVGPAALRFLDRSAECPVARAQGELLAGSLEDGDVVARFADGLSRATFESENTPVDVVEWLAQRGVDVFPGALSLRISQDRLLEKRWLNDLGVETAPFEAVDDLAGLRSAVARIGVPGILKTRRFGYDGKGQARIASVADVEEAWRAVAGAPCVYEGMVEFVREVSQISARGRDGQVVHYPLTVNEHCGGILRRSVAPAPGARGRLESAACAMMERLLDSLGHVGVLALELFETADGRLVANEMAPRVHNSGHWTIEGAACSQFENHLRAGLGLPLGSGRMKQGVARAEMVNFIGTMPDAATLARMRGEGWQVHDYGKRPAPGRKVGHATRLEMAG